MVLRSVSLLTLAVLMEGIPLTYASDLLKFRDQSKSRVW